MADKCDLPPEGWRCTRQNGHTGPCAAIHKGRHRLPLITNRAYQAAIIRWAKELGSDGCTKVPDFRLPACYEHDCHWRTGKTWFGDPITIQQANNRFWDSTRRLSRLPRGANMLDPMAAWRWAGVSISGLFR